MKFRFPLLAVVAALCLHAHAQTTTITATEIKGSVAGTPLASGLALQRLQFRTHRSRLRLAWVTS